jgi:hypothetical protein
VGYQYEGFEAVVGIEPERALNIGVGVAQAPLWAAFYASAGLGAAFWWSTAWTRAMPNFDFAALLAPEPSRPVEAYLEALDGAVCDLIETSEDKADEIQATVEAVQDSAELAYETATEAVTDAAEAAVEAIPEPLVETVSAQPATQAAAEALSFASDADTPVVELVTLEPTAQSPALADARAEAPARKASKKTAKSEA